MTVWYIIAAFFMLLIIILLSSIRFFFSVRIGQESVFICKFWFLKFNLLESDNRKKKQKTTEKSINDKKRLDIRLKSYDDIILFFQKLRDILYHLKKFLRHILIKNTKMQLTVVGDDAADTAIKYGAACAAIYPVLTLLSECFSFEPKNIDVKAGFIEKQTDLSLQTDFSVRIIYLIIFAKSLIKEYLEYSRRNEK